MHRILTHGRLRDISCLALFAALQLLAGHAQTTGHSMLLMSVFAAYWLVRYERTHWRRVLLAVGAMALAVGTALVKLLPTAQLLSQSQRSSGVDYAFAMNYSYGPLRTANFLFPNFFGNP